jgi:hypothetical protein
MDNLPSRGRYCFARDSMKKKDKRPKKKVQGAKCMVIEKTKDQRKTRHGNDNI